ncbi:MAG: hypothetical protein HW386_706 [Gammaproteobacteria bacterium]|nr:hypothetical protein [Gammaproteobacteria bacterium]
MRVNKLILFVLTFLATVNCNAADLVLEPQAMLYYRVTFGGNRAKQTQPTFGFRLDRTLHEKNKPVDYRQLFQQQAVLDFKMNQNGAESLTIAGVDYLKQYRLMRAAEEESAAASDSEAETTAAPPAEESAPAAEEATAEAATTEEATAEEATAEETQAEEATAEEATAEEATTEEATAEEVPVEEEPGFFENMPEIVEESQHFGLFIGALIGIVIAAGSF